MPNGQPDCIGSRQSTPVQRGWVCHRDLQHSSVPHKRIDARIAAVTPVSQRCAICEDPTHGRANWRRLRRCGLRARGLPIGGGRRPTGLATQTHSNTCQYSTVCVTNYGSLPVTLWWPGDDHRDWHGEFLQPHSRLHHARLLHLLLRRGVSMPWFSPSSPTSRAQALLARARSWTGGTLVLRPCRHRSTTAGPRVTPRR